MSRQLLPLASFPMHSCIQGGGGALERGDMEASESLCQPPMDQPAPLPAGRNE
jgi:hypothetical protein